MVQTYANYPMIQPRYAQQISMFPPQQRTVMIVYDQPKVVVVRRYSRAIIPQVNPDDYRRKFDGVLLDTSALLAMTRRLNIRDSEVRQKHTSSVHCNRTEQLSFSSKFA
jgi:hypothetical protein